MTNLANFISPPSSMTPHSPTDQSYGVASSVDIRTTIQVGLGQAGARQEARAEVAVRVGQGCLYGLVHTHPVVENVPSNQKVETVPCPETGDIEDVIVDVAALSSGGFTYDCPSCGTSQTITTETF
jgi:predicted RNA-binding Zn-ribbon protein involved in translation (DUF1610 family)